MKPSTIESNYKIAIYVRESRDDYEENLETIETQRDLLTDFVKRHNLGEIFRIYIDDNVSGSIFERNGIEQLKADIQAKAINMLLVKDLSRLGRNNAKTLLFLEYLEENCIRVITFDGKYDSIRDNDTVGIETWFNERYIRDISKKIRANLKFKIQKGEYIGHAPFGYKKSKEVKNKLCIDENKAEVIKKIFSLYREGYGYSYISKYLSQKGFPTPSQKSDSDSNLCLWNAVAVKRILSNRVYVGDTVQGVSEKLSFKSKKTKRLPKEKWVITENTHEGIIGKEEFAEVQKIIAIRGAVSNNHKGKIHLFKSIVFCGKCGSTMFARIKENDMVGYVCGNYFKNGKKACSSHYVKEFDIKNVIIDELNSLFNNPSVFEKAKDLLEKKFLECEEISGSCSKLEQQINSKQRQQDILYMDRLEGKITEQLFLRMNANIENRISQLRHEIEKERQHNEQKAKTDELMKNAIKDIFDKGMTNELIKIFTKKIVIYDNTDNYGTFESYDIDIKEHKKGAVVIELNYGSS